MVQTISATYSIDLRGAKQAVKHLYNSGGYESIRGYKENCSLFSP